jgi:hypothetical protein
MTYYMVQFNPRDDDYPDYFLCGKPTTKKAAVLAAIADYTQAQVDGRKHYNALCYYDIAEYDSDHKHVMGFDESTDNTWNAEELAAEIGVHNAKP